MSVYIIAEAGVNHNGDISIAFQLVDAAVAAGADCIKFQTFKADKLVSKNAKKADYQLTSRMDEEDQLSMLKKLELSFDDFKELKAYCQKKGIDFLSTAFDMESLGFLNGLGVACWKIPSGELTNLPFISKVAEFGEPILMSTGMATMEEVSESLRVIREKGSGDVTVLHCTTEYPAPFEEVNLKAMVTMKNAFNVRVGYSDHTEGIDVPIAAVALGATVIEKHFTLDRQMEGPDHQASLEPEMLALMVKGIRRVEAALGNGLKAPTPSELKNVKVARKSIVANCKIRSGDTFTEENLTTKRPGTGMSPMLWYSVIGTKAGRDYEVDEQIDG